MEDYIVNIQIIKEFMTNTIRLIVVGFIQVYHYL